MGKQLFGTDGIRGVAGEFPLDPATIHAFGLALGADLRHRAPDAAILIGMDTRESGPWIAAAGRRHGLAQQGVPVVSVGRHHHAFGIAWLTPSSSFTAGVMISASHNPYHDNGIKVFGHSGYKLPDDEEHEVEQEIFRHAGQAAGAPLPLAPDPALAERYLDYLASTVSGGFDGMRVVLDCGNGAASKLAPELFGRLGAQVETLCSEPNGRNINLNCGALHVESLRAAVGRNRARTWVWHSMATPTAPFSSRAAAA